MTSTMTINQAGTKMWRNQDGQLHRTLGPAVEYANGRKEWWVDGQLHRTDGPAIEGSGGTKAWYLNGQRHQTDGPAVEYADGHKEWWVDDQQLSEEEWREALKK
jgi:hypothetical protein